MNSRYIIHTAAQQRKVNLCLLPPYNRALAHFFHPFSGIQLIEGSCFFCGTRSPQIIRKISPSVSAVFCFITLKIGQQVMDSRPMHHSNRKKNKSQKELTYWARGGWVWQEWASAKALHLTIVFFSMSITVRLVGQGRRGSLVTTLTELRVCFIYLFFSVTCIIMNEFSVPLLEQFLFFFSCYSYKWEVTQMISVDNIRVRDLPCYIPDVKFNFRGQNLRPGFVSLIELLQISKVAFQRSEGHVFLLLITRQVCFLLVCLSTPLQYFVWFLSHRKCLKVLRTNFKLNINSSIYTILPGCFHFFSSSLRFAF